MTRILTAALSLSLLGAPGLLLADEAGAKTEGKQKTKKNPDGSVEKTAESKVETKDGVGGGETKKAKKTKKTNADGSTETTTETKHEAK